MKPEIVDLAAVSNKDVEVLTSRGAPLAGVSAAGSGESCGGCGGKSHRARWRTQAEMLSASIQTPEAASASVGGYELSARQPVRQVEVRWRGTHPELSFVGPLDRNPDYPNASPILHFEPVEANVVWHQLRGPRAYPLIDRLPREPGATDPGCATYHPFTDSEWEVLAGAWIYAESAVPVPPRDAAWVPWSRPADASWAVEGAADAAWALTGPPGSYPLTPQNLAWRLATSLHNRGSIEYDASDPRGPRIGRWTHGRRPLSLGGEWVRHAEYYLRWLGGGEMPPNLLMLTRADDVPQADDIARLSLAAFQLQTGFAFRLGQSIGMWLWTSCASVIRFAGYDTMDGWVQVGGWHPPSAGWWEPRRDGGCAATGSVEGRHGSVDGDIGTLGAREGERPGGSGGGVDHGEELIRVIDPPVMDRHPDCPPAFGPCPGGTELQSYASCVLQAVLAAIRYAQDFAPRYAGLPRRSVLAYWNEDWIRGYNGAISAGLCARMVGCLPDGWRAGHLWGRPDSDAISGFIFGAGPGPTPDELDTMFMGCGPPRTTRAP